MKTQSALAAAAIKRELKSRFPGIKFSVKSENYTGGDSVRINYTDGVRPCLIEEIVAKYEYGHFNGMEDIYEYSNCREDIPQAKYIFVNRELSEETENLALQLLKEDRGITPENCWDNLRCDIHTAIWRLSNGTL